MENKREVWVDWMRVIACFMVMVVHSTEPFYIGGDGSLIASRDDSLWAAFFDTFARCCVPLFVIASSYLQFPLHYPTGEFIRRRASRILVPFVIWSVFYAFYWGEPASNFKDLLLNFNIAAGHLWFVYMLVGLYILMPLLSPWAEKVSRKEHSIYIAIWFFTTLIPLIRDWVASEPISVIYGPNDIPRQALFPLWGEACWNSYGTFYYFSGFIGFLLVGLWLRKFGSLISAHKSFVVGVPCFLGGFAISFSGFIRRVAESAAGGYPVAGHSEMSVWWETTWGYDTIGVAMMTIGAILMLKNICSDGKFYTKVLLPVSKASYGMYLSHMVALAAYAGLFRSLIPSTPLVIVFTAVSSFVTVAVLAVAVQRIPKVGKLIVG